MVGFLKQYPYLCWSALLLMVFLAIFFVVKEARRIMIISGIASAIYSFAAIVFVPEYWQPVLLIQSTVGLEDLVFSFANGGIVCFLAIWPFRRKMTASYTLGSLVGRFLIWTFIGAILCYTIRRTGASVMTCFLFTMMIIGIMLLLQQKWYWPLSLAGAIGFSVLYVGVMAFLGFCFPDFHQQWTLPNLYGQRFLTFPLEEFLWALGFGAVFPMIMASVFQIRIIRLRVEN